LAPAFKWPTIAGMWDAEGVMKNHEVYLEQPPERGWILEKVHRAVTAEGIRLTLGRRRTTVRVTLPDRTVMEKEVVVVKLRSPVLHIPEFVSKLRPYLLLPSHRAFAEEAVRRAEVRM